ncbi:mevalonate kinase [Nocardia sp. NPDC055321]
MSRIGHGAAHAKVILFGEHVVLYGNPAIALPVPELTATAAARHRRGPVRIDFTGAGPSATAGRMSMSKLDAWTIPRLAVSVTCEHLGVPVEALGIELHSEIPVGRGLGSSAALAGAVIEAVADLHEVVLSTDQHYELIQRCESFAHGRASGIDARTVTHRAGPLWFHAGNVRPLAVAHDADMVLTVVDTGVLASTHQAVELVRDRMAALGGDRTEALLARAWALTVSAVEQLADGWGPALGAGMTENHAILREFGVSSGPIEEIVTAALDVGAWGAKLSGGGLGGCVLVAGPEVVTDKLTPALSGTSATVVTTIVPGRA